MSTLPEQKARVEIDALVNAVGWALQDVAVANPYAARGVVEFKKQRTGLKHTETLRQAALASTFSSDGEAST